MQDDSIYLLSDDGSLERVAATAYSAEKVLQEFIARYPELLAGEQMNPDDPPQWILVSQEAGIPDEKGAADRWSADHLLLDQHARPTIVEIKRSSDTRIRREVIGQLLEYAANASVYWPSDRIRVLAAATYGGTDQLDQRIRGLLSINNDSGSLADIEEYWSRVHENLRTGKLRLLFVADELPRELRKVIEFLNEHMASIEVLGVEVRQFAGRNMRALVPRVVGQTERARQEKTKSSSRKISKSEFIESCPEWCRTFFEDLFEDSNRNSFRVVFGTKGFSVRVAQEDGSLITLLWGFPPGSFGREAPAIDVFHYQLSPFENREAISRALTQVGFRGETTLTMLLNVDNLKAGREALEYIWGLGRKIRDAM